MQKIMDIFDAACENFVLIMNAEKTVFMYQSPPNTAHNVRRIIVNGTQLQVMGNFTYLGSTLSRSTKIDDEAARRIFKALPILCPTAEHRLGPSRSPPQHQAEAVQGSHSTDAAVRSVDLDGLREASAEAQSLPPRLS
ncbi:hypothetical protein SprV_0100063000 [Sparganum proliferum]